MRNKISDQDAVQHYTECAKGFDMNPRDVEVVVKDGNRRFVTGVVDVHEQRWESPAQIGTYIDGGGESIQDVEERIEFNLKLYSGNTQHTQEVAST